MERVKINLSCHKVAKSADSLFILCNYFHQGLSGDTIFMLLSLEAEKSRISIARDKSPIPLRPSDKLQYTNRVILHSSKFNSFLPQNCMIASDMFSRNEISWVKFH